MTTGDVAMGIIICLALAVVLLAIIQGMPRT